MKLLDAACGTGMLVFGDLPFFAVSAKDCAAPHCVATVIARAYSERFHCVCVVEAAHADNCLRLAAVL